MKRSLTKYVIFSIAILLIYTIADLVISITTGQSNDTLTTCLFACFGGEILSCALIKIFKLKSPQMPEVMSEEELSEILKNLYKEDGKNADG